MCAHHTGSLTKCPGHIRRCLGSVGNRLDILRGYQRVAATPLYVEPQVRAQTRQTLATKRQLNPRNGIRQSDSVRHVGAKRTVASLPRRTMRENEFLPEASREVFDRLEPGRLLQRSRQTS